ncbi:MAG: ParA family protein [Candidatus Omnitrophica bacterium]|nr:ParA family protein [Candidatus Omnitrophota bacterium]
MFGGNGGSTSTVRGKRSFSIRNFLFGIRTHGHHGDGELDEDQTRLPADLRPVVISIMNQKGGCGKTTTAVNLSAALAEKGYRVLVIDMDPQAHASLGFGISLEPFRRSVYDLLTDPNTSFGDVMHATAIPRLDLLPASIQLSSAQLELANMSRGEITLKRVLAPAQKAYDFVFIDCPPTLNLLTLNALAYATKVLIPVQAQYYAMDGMKELFRTIEAVKNRFNPDLEILGILPSLFDKRISISTEILAALREHFTSSMFKTVINTNVKLIEAPMAQQPIISYAPHSAASTEFNRLAEEVVNLVTKEN